MKTLCKKLDVTPKIVLSNKNSHCPNDSDLLISWIVSQQMCWPNVGLMSPASLTMGQRQPNIWATTRVSSLRKRGRYYMSYVVYPEI